MAQRERAHHAFFLSVFGKIKSRNVYLGKQQYVSPNF
jgi:hypothetical protein